MKVKSMRPLALLMAVVMLLGLFPSAAFAVESEDDSALAANSIVTTSVEYGSTERETATITYHKKIQEAPAANIVFLLDASWQGGETLPQLQQMLNDHVGDLIDHTNASMQVISYTQNVILHSTTDGSVVTTASGLYDLISGIDTGEGTADAAKAIDKATEVVGQINNNNPTVVFWAFGESFGSSTDEQVEDALKNLTAKLDSDDALITWQLADAPNALVRGHATTYTADDGEHTAAYAESDAAAFRAGTLDSLDRVFHDHYRDLKLTLPLASGQTLAKKITAANWDSDDYDLPEIEATVADGAVTLSIDKLCANITGDLTVDLVLDTDVNEKQTVLSEATASGRYTGFFDEKKEDASLVFPEVDLDRQNYTITFDAKDATGTAPDDITAMAGQYVTLPDGGNLSKEGSALGGWNDSDGNHYTIGQIIAMPAQNLTLTPAWGHVEIELELGEVYAAEASGHQMSVNAKKSGLLDFSDVIIDGETPFGDTIHSITFDNDDVSYDTAPDTNDPNKVTVTDESLGAVYARHVGATTGDHVVAYLRKCQCDEQEEGKYDLIIAGPGGVIAPANMSQWQYKNSDVEMIDFTNLDTSQVTNMYALLSGCSNLKQVTFGDNFDTSKVENMYDMFSSCSSLKYVNLNMFDTSNVTNMYAMFWHCTSLKEVNLSSFDTSKVEEIGRMFEGCSNLTKVTFGESFTNDVLISTGYMFYGCSNLTDLDLSNFKTPSVQNMKNMFLGCSKLTSLDLSSFDTSAVTDMSGMFSSCTGLEELKLGEQFDTSDVTTMDSMFWNCEQLETLDLGKLFDTSKVENMNNMFSMCKQLKEIEFGDRFYTSQVTSMENMFYQCESLTSLTLPDTFNTAHVTTMKQMFIGCVSLTSLTLPEAFNTSNVQIMNGMFSGCGALEKVDLGNQFYLQNVTDLGGMFQYDSALKKIEGALKFSAGTDNCATTMANMFYRCTALDGVDFVYVDQYGQSATPNSVSFPALKDMSRMFASCNELTRINLGGWVLPDLTNTMDMFAACTKLDSLDLSWTKIAAVNEGEAAFDIRYMFNYVPETATLRVASEDNGQLSTFMQAVVDAFPGTKYVDGEEWNGTTTNEPSLSEAPTSGDDTTTPSDEPQDDVTTPEETPSENPDGDVTTPEETPSDDSQGDVTTPEETPSDNPQGDVTTPEETPVDDPQDDVTTPEETPVDEPQDDVTTPEETPVDEPQDDVTTPEETPVDEPSNDDATTDAGAENTQPATASARVLSEPAVQADGDGDYTVNDNGSIWTHKVRTPAGSQFQYLVRVKYVGDTGAQSGSIQVRFPIPKDVRVLNKSELATIGADDLVEVGAVEESTTANGFLGGRVTNADYDDTTNTLTATVDGLYAGNEVEISIWCTNESKTFPSEGGYVYWDGTAYARDEAASVPSNIYRLWDVKGAAVNPPAADLTLRYEFAGSVPQDATLPTTSTHEAGEELTAAKEPATKYKYYDFDGWTYTDGGKQKKVEPDATFIMPNADTTLVGTWTLNKDEAPTMTVQYQYDNSAPANAPELPVDAKVTIGERYTVSALQDNYDSLYASFNGWVPSLSVDERNVPLTKDEDGRYSGGGYSIPTTGVLATTQFLYKEDVVLTFTGSWTAYTGTIRFDANGGQGTMKEMTNVTHDTSVPLTANTFTRDGYTFTGWAASENGQVIKNDQDDASGLIKINGQTVTLYAQWRAKPITSRVIIVTPADIIIYMGGKDGYKGTVNDEGEIEASSSLPEPGFVFDLPEELETALAENSADITDVKFQSADDDSKTWKVKLYQGLDESAANKLYTIVPTYDKPDPVRVVFTDGDKHIVSDEFTVGLEINKDFGMSLYTGPAGKIKAVYGGQEYPVELGEGTLTVLGTTEKVSITTVTDQAPTNGQPGAIADAGTTYTINDSEVSVTDGDVSLLFDGIINNEGNDRTGKLETRASEWLADEGITPSAQHQFVYELKYLDLVDANNGNAWVTASQDLTIYWPLPDGVDTSTVKVLHFKDLHRDMDTGEIEEEIEGCEVELRDTEIEGGYITFKVGRGGFSPFALVWEEKIPTYTITATAGTGGSITPAGVTTVQEGGSQSYTIKADSGYHISDVKVNGVSGGAVESYTFTNVRSNQTIAVTFSRNSSGGGGGGGGHTKPSDPDEDIPDESGPADPFDTGVGNWLNTKDHNAYLGGYGGGLFGPDDNMTRGQAAQMFYNLLLDKDVPITVSFTDVAPDAWYATAVNTLASLGIVTGYGNGQFGPDDSITRAQFTTIAMRFANLDTSGENIFTDVSEDDWFYEFVVGAIKYGWIGGYPDGRFGPNDTITRAQVTTIVNRMLGRSADEDYVERNIEELTRFTDVPDTHWAYYNIMEATNAHDYDHVKGQENWTRLHR